MKEKAKKRVDRTIIRCGEVVEISPKQQVWHTCTYPCVHARMPANERDHFGREDGPCVPSTSYTPEPQPCTHATYWFSTIESILNSQIWPFLSFHDFLSRATVIQFAKFWFEKEKKGELGEKHSERKWRICISWWIQHSI